MHPKHPNHPSRYLAAGLAFGLFAAWVLLSTGCGLVAQFHSLPFYDDWYTAFEAIAFAEHRLSWAQFVDQHNEHRLAVPKLAFLADYSLFAGKGILTQSVICAAQGLNAVLLCALIRIGRGDRPKIARPRFTIAASLIVASMLWGPQIINLGWNIQLSVIGVYSAVTATLAAIVIATTSGSTTARRLWLGIAITAGFAATFSRANGVLVWPLAVSLAWLLRLPTRGLVALSTAGAVCGAMFFIGYQNPAGTDPIRSIGQLASVLHFALCYLGLPARAFGLEAALVLGGIGGAIATAACVRLVRHQRGLPPGEATLHVLLLFPLATAAVTAFGRIQFEPPDWPSRYITPAMYFWAVLIALVVRWSAAHGNHRLRLIVGAAAVAFASLLAIQQQAGCADRRPRYDDRRLAAASLGSGVYDEPLMQRVTLNRATNMHDVTYSLRQRRLTSFAAPRFGWVGDMLGDHIDGMNPTPVAGDGAFTAWHNVPAPTAGVAVSGWLSKAMAQATEFLVVVDPTGRIVGYAEVDLRHPATDRADGMPVDGVPWAGYARILELDPPALRVFAVQSGETSSAFALTGSRSPSLEVDPRFDSIGAQLHRMHAEGSRDVPAQLIASADTLQALLGMTLPATPDSAPTSNTSTITRFERFVGSHGIRVQGEVDAVGISEFLATMVVDDQLRVLGIDPLEPRGSATGEPTHFDITALLLASHDVDWSICLLRPDGTGMWLPAGHNHRGEDVTVAFDRLGTVVQRARADLGGVWHKRGIFEDYFPAPTGERVFDSWGGDDRRIGTLRIAPISNREQPTQAIALPILVGPTPDDLEVRLVDRVTGTTLATLSDLRPFVGFWRAWRMELPAGLHSDRLAIVVTDGSQDFGGWIAVTMPHWID